MPKITILIADDHPMLREGIRHVLGREDDFEILGEASDGEEALSLAKELRPDIVVLDVGMPKLNGLEVTKRIRAECPSTAVLVLTIHDDDEYVLGLLKAGATGYLLKGARGQDLVEALRVIHRGKSLIDPVAMRKLVEHVSPHYPDSSILRPRYKLTKRETQVLRLVIRGLSNKEIAQELRVSLPAVKARLGNVFNKMGVGSRTEAIYKAVTEGVVDLGEMAKA